MIQPAQELRTAAQTLRGLTQAVGGDTWTADHFPEGTIIRPANSTVSLLRLAADGMRAAGTPHVTAPVGAYIAAMGPNVGALLADVFMAWARIGELDPDLLNRVGGPETLAVARAINDGGQP